MARRAFGWALSLGPKESYQVHSGALSYIGLDQDPRMQGLGGCHKICSRASLGPKESYQVKTTGAIFGRSTGMTK